MPDAEGRAADYASLAASGNALDVRVLPGVPGARGASGVLDADRHVLAGVLGAVHPADLGAHHRPAAALGVDRRAAETAIQPVMDAVDVPEIANRHAPGAAGAPDSAKIVRDVKPIAAPAAEVAAGVNRVPDALGRVLGAADVPDAAENAMVAVLPALDAVRALGAPGVAGVLGAVRPADLRARPDVRDAVLDADQGALGAMDVPDAWDSAKIHACQLARDAEIIVRGLATDRQQARYKKGRKV